MESTGSQKKSKTEEKLEKDRLGGSRQMRQYMERSLNDGGGRWSQMEMHRKCPVCPTARKGILLPLSGT